MPGLNEILLALMLTGGGHEMGHQVEADRLDEALDFNGTQWTTPANGDNLAKISGAGFAMQDKIGDARDDKTQNVVNGLHKLSYVLTDRGDLKSIGKTKGKTAKKVAKVALAVSAIDDIFGDSRFGFGQSSTGTPMLTFGGKF